MVVAAVRAISKTLLGRLFEKWMDDEARGTAWVTSHKLQPDGLACRPSGKETDWLTLWLVSHPNLLPQPLFPLITNHISADPQESTVRHLHLLPSKPTSLVLPRSLFLGITFTLYLMSSLLTHNISHTIVYIPLIHFSKQSSELSSLSPASAPSFLCYRLITSTPRSRSP
ncbi:hypothetical protein DL93DRAFT_1317859 [Clavulina sp. PMI_390]|nr:hypothetical protein DL93DRAFT_1317859 [Clavulina sp. PMI_390]